MSGSEDSHRHQVTKAASYLSDICPDMPATAIQPGTRLDLKG